MANGNSNFEASLFNTADRLRKNIDAAMMLIEKENSELKNVLPKVYAKPNLDKTALGQLICEKLKILLSAQILFCKMKN